MVWYSPKTSYFLLKISLHSDSRLRDYPFFFELESFFKNGLTNIKVPLITTSNYVKLLNLGEIYKIKRRMD